MSSVAFATTNVEVDGAITLDGTQATDTRLDMKYNATTATQVINTSVDSVTIHGTDGYGLNTAGASLTFNIQGTLTATNTIKLPTTTRTLAINTSITMAEMESFLAGETISRTVLAADYIQSFNPASFTFTLNGIESCGLTDGGLVFGLNSNGTWTYYNSANVTVNGDGYATLNADATAIELEDGKLYTIAEIRGVKGASVKGLGFSATAITETVPEPATATLSLLALAGLAARRRRK